MMKITVAPALDAVAVLVLLFAFVLVIAFAPALLAEAPLDKHGDADPGAERAEGFGRQTKAGLREGMTPFVLPWDDATPGPTDMSGLNHKPAGKFGYIKAGPDGELYAGKERVRMLGTNLIFRAAIPMKDQAEKIAARMAKFGINVVRFHHIDNNHALLTDDTTSRTMNAEHLDRLDYLIAQLKKHGIYTNLNLLVSRRFQAGDGAGPLNEVKGKLQHVIGFWHEPAFKLHAEYATQLLSHRNPYTKLTYAEDPAVAYVEIINENGLANTWLSPRRSAFSGSLEALPEEFAKPLRDKWNAYLKATHGNVEKAAKAWGIDAETRDVLIKDGVAQFVPLDDLKGFRARPLGLRVDWLSFLRQVESDYYHRMMKLLRDDLGYGGMIMGSTVHSGWLNVMDDMDVIDSHVYWSNPRWRGRTWDYGGMQWHIDNVSHVGAYPGGRLRWLALGQVQGKPFSVSEYNHSAPNVFAGEGPLFLAAHAGLQGWDALYLFPYEGSSARFDSQAFFGNHIGQHPMIMANMVSAALLFRRYDMQQANVDVTAWLSPEKEIEAAAKNGSSWNIAHGSDVGLDGDDTMRHRIAVITGDKKPADVNPSRDWHVGGAVESDNGQLRLHRADKDRCVLMVDTPRTKAVMGYGENQVLRLGEVTIIPGNTMDDGATITFSLLEGETFKTGKRGLIIATGRAENTGMTWRKVFDENARDPAQPRWELSSWGKAPTTIEPVPMEIRVPGKASQITVYPLDERGQRRDGETVDVKQSNATTASILITPKHKTLWYEVVWKR